MAIGSNPLRSTRKSARAVAVSPDLAKEDLDRGPIGGLLPGVQLERAEARQRGNLSRS
jgi:hypothetical protein